MGYIHLYHRVKGTAFKVKEKKSFKQKVNGIMLMKKVVGAFKDSKPASTGKVVKCYDKFKCS